jgi:hypothetical protein
MLTPRAPSIRAMLDMMEPGDWHQIRFEVGKLGRVDRFVLTKGRPAQSPEEISELLTEPPDETAAVLAVLDQLATIDPHLGLMYNNPRETRYAYCLWSKMVDKKDWATGGVSALYRRRIDEQRRIAAGKLKQGHRAFGFWPREGYR